MTPKRIQELIHVYSSGLLEDTLPFWLKYALDREHGGYFSALDRDGSLLDTDKSVWLQGRFAWLLSTLYRKVEPRSEWLEAAKLGIDFLQQHCMDTDGRFFFQVTGEGQPLRKRRYVFSEMFAVIAFASYPAATGDDQLGAQAQSLFDLACATVIEPKVNPTVRPSKGFGMPMIKIATAQELRDSLNDESYTHVIDDCIAEIEQHFLKPDLQAVMETVGPRGEILDHLDGRTLNPGHAMEGAWFLLQEAKFRQSDARLIRLGTTMLDWMWQRGWDQEYGGILYYRDVYERPPQEYWHDMKFWWPQCEALIATLLAYQLTGNSKYADWHQQIHDWTYDHFPDREFGEWFGYLHRDGRLSQPAKGNFWKGPFHIPRMQWLCWKIASELNGAFS